jgi:hypothetical protein
VADGRGSPRDPIRVELIGDRARRENAFPTREGREAALSL